MLLAHPGAGVREIRGPEEATLFVSSEGLQTYFKWMQAEFGFAPEDQVKPYTFNPQPFLVDKHSAMQGYVTSEPFAVEKAGVKPKIFLLADHGFNTYSTLIETRREVVEKQPGLVQRFVDASAIGWYNYLYGDNKAANELIRKHNPEMSQELIDYSIAKMKEYGIVDSGDTLKARHRRDDRRAHGELLRQDGEGRRGQAERRFPQVLHAAVRQQGRGTGAAAEEVVSPVTSFTTTPSTAITATTSIRLRCSRNASTAAMIASAVAFRSSASGSNANQRKRAGVHFRRPRRTARAARTRP